MGQVDIGKFKNDISGKTVLLTVVMAILGAAVILVLSLAGDIDFKKTSVKYLYGLFIGMAVAQMNFIILAHTLQAMVATGKKSLIPFSYMVRMLIYGTFFYFCVKQSYIAGLACVLGFMSIKLVMYYFYGAKSKFTKDRKPPEWAEEWDLKYDFGDDYDELEKSRSSGEAEQSGFKRKKIGVVKKYKKSKDYFK